jgi:transcriptional regulator with XRE-family HTH domain
MTLSENMKKYRKKIGMTQKMLSVQSGLSYSMVSKLESGEQSNPSYETLKKISKVLNVSPAELLENEKSIEEQIDEYIAYKRGLKSKLEVKTSPELKQNASLGKPGTQAHAPGVGSETEGRSSQDINFLRRLSAINTIPKPENHSDEEYISFLHERPELKRLFSAFKSATKEEIEQTIQQFETTKG